MDNRMIIFYAESRMDTMESSQRLMEEVLCRIFRQLEEYGVVITDHSIKGLSGEVLQRWANGVRKNHKVTTYNNYVCLLNPFLKWAHMMTHGDECVKYISADLSGILHTMKLPSYDKLPEEERPKDKYYSIDQINELLTKPSANDTDLDKRDRAVIALFLASGLRVSELCSLTIGSIYDREHGLVYVKRKGGAWKNTEVAEFAYKYIDDYMQTRSDRNDMSKPLFVTVNGDPCNRVQLYKCMAKKQKKMDVQTGCHVFRHNFISAAEKAGGVAVARDLANHKSFAITNRYDHSNAQERSAAVNSLPWAKQYTNTRKTEKEKFSSLFFFFWLILEKICD